MDLIMDGDFYGGGGNSSDYAPYHKNTNYSNMFKTITTNRIELSRNLDTTIGPYNVSDTFDEMKKELDNLKTNMNRKLNITMLHGCRNCGAKMDVDINKPVFCCKYCGTSYVIGTVHQNSTY